MRPSSILPLAIIFSALSAAAAGEQIASLLLPPGLAKSERAVDSLTTPTAGVKGTQSLAKVTATIRGQKAIGDDALKLRTFTVSSHFIQLSRYENTEAVGAIQYKIDLSPLRRFFENNDKRLTSLPLSILLSNGDGGREMPCDIYFSYSAPQEDILISDISLEPSGSEDNYKHFFAPAQDVDELTIVEGRFVAFRKGLSGRTETQVELKEIFASGVNEINLILMTASFGGGNRRVIVHEGSGVYMQTQ